MVHCASAIDAVYALLLAAQATNVLATRTSATSVTPTSSACRGRECVTAGSTVLAPPMRPAVVSACALFTTRAVVLYIIDCAMCTQIVRFDHGLFQQPDNSDCTSFCVAAGCD